MFCAGAGQKRSAPCPRPPDGGKGAEGAFHRFRAVPVYIAFFKNLY